MKPAFLERFFLDKEHREKRNFLQSLPIFSELENKDFTYLMRVLHEHNYLKGETLFAEGDIGRALFIVMKGSVALSRRQQDGSFAEIAEVKPGELFGEMALLEEMPRTASATAAENTKVLLLYKNKLDALLKDQPQIGVEIIHYLAQTLSSRFRAIMGKAPAK